MISPYNGHSSVGKLRYNLPQSISPYVGNYDARKFGLACPQQTITIPAVPDLASPVVDFIANSIYGRVFPDSEDCKLKRRVRFRFKALTTLSGLTLNVIKPALAGPNSRLPVVVVRAYQTWSGYVLNSFAVDFWRFVVQ